MKTRWFISIGLLLLVALPVSAGTIYSWIDAEGKQRFSDQQPPDTVTDFKTIQTAPESGDSAGSAPQRRSSYDRMVDKSRQESEQSDQKRQKEAAERELEERRIAEEKRKARNEPVRRRLEQEIKQLENRALSPTFSLGMKQNLIEIRRKQLKELDAPTGKDAQ